MVEIIALFFIVILLMFVAICAINIIVLICKVKCFNIVIVKKINLISEIISNIFKDLKKYNDCVKK